MALESLRIPLEEKKVTINRLQTSITYPCQFMLIASMNPCQCGYYGSKEKQCSCKLEQIKKYINRVSGPLLDRMDIHIEVNSIPYKKLRKKEEIESSEKIRKRVNQAREKQRKRYQIENIMTNAELTPKLIEKYCELDYKSKKMLETAFERLGLSVRAYNRILRVARTIADLENAEKINQNHLAEAIQYRSLDRKYWYHK